MRNYKRRENNKINMNCIMATRTSYKNIEERFFKRFSIGVCHKLESACTIIGVFIFFEVELY